MKHTILIVEDERDLREAMQEALELSGYEVVSAADGRSALDALARVEHVCVVLLDLLMPGMNGWDFCKELRARPAFDDVPVVVHSSSRDALPEGINGAIQKPTDLSRLLSVVRQFCER